jgi:glutathione S-transferase
LKGIIVLYGVPLSPNTQRVLVVLAEKGLKYEFKKIKFMESEHKVRATLNKNMG